ncbi:unnamed protein product, partial [marine sediment metagenome]
EVYVNDNLSAKYFVGLAVDQKAPDHSTLTKFRKRLIERGSLEAFEEMLSEIIRIALESGVQFGSIQIVDSVHSVANVNIVSRLEIPPDARSDEISLQIVKCNRCKFESVAIYEESHRGALDSDVFDHYGYTIDQKELKELKALIRQCSEPKNRRCSCDSHRALRRKDSSGRWIRPGFNKDQRTFRMVL